VSLESLAVDHFHGVKGVNIASHVGKVDLSILAFAKELGRQHDLDLVSGQCDYLARMKVKGLITLH